MIKGIGLVALMAFCTGCGILIAGNLRKRADALKKTQFFIHLLGESLGYTLSPVDELFRRLTGEPLLTGLDFIPACRDRLESREPFPETFRECVENSRCGLNAQDRAVLCELCPILGASSVENQLSGLELLKARLSEQSLQAKEACEKKSKLYASLGILSGIALVVMLL